MTGIEQQFLFNTFQGNNTNQGFGGFGFGQGGNTFQLLAQSLQLLSTLINSNPLMQRYQPNQFFPNNMGQQFMPPNQFFPGNNPGGGFPIMPNLFNGNPMLPGNQCELNDNTVRIDRDVLMDIISGNIQRSGMVEDEEVNTDDTTTTTTTAIDVNNLEPGTPEASRRDFIDFLFEGETDGNITVEQLNTTNAELQTALGGLEPESPAAQVNQVRQGINTFLASHIPAAGGEDGQLTREEAYQFFIQNDDPAILTALDGHITTANELQLIPASTTTTTTTTDDTTTVDDTATDTPVDPAMETQNRLVANGWTVGGTRNITVNGEVQTATEMTIDGRRPRLIMPDGSMLVQAAEIRLQPRPDGSYIRRPLENWGQNNGDVEVFRNANGEFFVGREGANNQADSSPLRAVGAVRENTPLFNLLQANGFIND
ncbi:MAG: hypothetical protein SFZ03_05770 [Candidatus Melainabacteria bacterium]|nr:hypothetical protein [Candidatus Melainabacteria bacterium]